MKKFTAILAVCLALAGLVSCGGGKKADKVFTIYAWNDEFLGMLKNYYCKDKGATVDSNGNVTFADGTKLNFVINPNDGGVYQQKLDIALDAGEKIDIFLIEADYAKKYVNTRYTLPISEVGITRADMNQMYAYTIDVGSSNDGVIKGASWQAAPGLFMYRASLAEKYLGVKTPEEMQELVKDWDTFVDTARKVAQASGGATKMVPSVDDLWQVFRTNRSSSWVSNGKLVFDPQADEFMELAKTLQSENLTADNAPWSEGWNQGIGNDSTLGYFFSTWGIQWTMVGNSGGSKPGEGTYGDWRAVKGPQSYYWGGTWLVVSPTVGDKALAEDIIRYYTINKDSMKNYCLGSKDYVNNKAAIAEIINAGYSFDFLGGQNHYALFQESADQVDTSTMSPYDQGINSAFQQAFVAYSRGEMTKDAALKMFRTEVANQFSNIDVN